METLYVCNSFLKVKIFKCKIFKISLNVLSVNLNELKKKVLHIRLQYFYSNILITLKSCVYR